MSSLWTLLAGDTVLLGVVFAALAAVAISCNSLALRVGTTSGGALDALIVVQLVNVALFVPAAVLLHAGDYRLTLTAVAAFGVAGLVGTVLGRAFTYTSIERIGASRTEPIKSSQPLHATVIAVLLLGETVNPAHFAGIVLIVVGIGVISWESTRRREEGVDAVAPRDLLIPLVGAFFYGIEPIFAKVGFAQGTPVLVGLSIKTIVAFVAFGAYLRARGLLPSSFGTANLRWYVVAGLCNSAFLFLYYLGLEVAPVSVVVPIVTTSPLVVVVLSWAFLSHLERVTWRLVTAASTVVVGAIVITLYG